ncbi:MAG: hypothetical protein GY820_28730 [Gammaproteobacteria bacterium]|nr:hypothetical protein [Gammaproteobacteria bacterium]
MCMCASRTHASRLRIYVTADARHVLSTRVNFAPFPPTVGDVLLGL